MLSAFCASLTAFRQVESLCITFFTIEYVVRILAADQKGNFVVAPMNVIDLVAIAPFYIGLVCVPRAPMRCMFTWAQYHWSPIWCIFHDANLSLNVPLAALFLKSREAAVIGPLVGGL